VVTFHDTPVKRVAQFLLVLMTNVGKDMSTTWGRRSDTAEAIISLVVDGESYSMMPPEARELSSVMRKQPNRLINIQRIADLLDKAIAGCAEIDGATLEPGDKVAGLPSEPPPNFPKQH